LFLSFCFTEEALYADFAQWVDSHIPPGINASLPPHHSFPGNCTGALALKQQGLDPPPFGGVAGYFGIMAGYLFVCIAVAFGALRARIRAQANV